MLAAEQLAEVDVSEGAAKKKQTRGNFNSWTRLRVWPPPVSNQLP